MGLPCAFHSVSMEMSDSSVILHVCDFPRETSTNICLCPKQSNKEKWKKKPHPIPVWCTSEFIGGTYKAVVTYGA